LTGPARPKIRQVTAASGRRVTVTLAFPTAKQSRAFYEALLACQEQEEPVGIALLAPRNQVKETGHADQ
jgi:hypothetical protein